MAIDYVIDWDCVPKQTLGTAGILERLKGKLRADLVIRLFRENGDQRPPSEMGFELTRTRADGTEENRVIVVQDMLDAAAELDGLADYCDGCPANTAGRAFGCMQAIQYPISMAAEVWLLKQLPPPEDPLPWLLLRQTVEEMGYTGERVSPLRAADSYFEDGRGFARGLGEFQVTTDQVFEMIFMVGHIQPAHAGALLLFFNAIPRDDIDADQVRAVLNRAGTPDERRAQHRFLIQIEDGDDTTTRDLKRFFEALYRAWLLDVRLLLDV